MSVCYGLLTSHTKMSINQVSYPMLSGIEGLPSAYYLLDPIKDFNFFSTFSHNFIFFFGSISHPTNQTKILYNIAKVFFKKLNQKNSKLTQLRH